MGNHAGFFCPVCLYSGLSILKHFIPFFTER